jgi:hypothetical protein
VKGCEEVFFNLVDLVFLNSRAKEVHNEARENKPRERAYYGEKKTDAMDKNYLFL